MAKCRWVDCCLLATQSGWNRGFAQSTASRPSGMVNWEFVVGFHRAAESQNCKGLERSPCCAWWVPSIVSRICSHPVCLWMLPVLETSLLCKEVNLIWDPWHCPILRKIGLFETSTCFFSLCQLSVLPLYILRKASPKFFLIQNQMSLFFSLIKMERS